MSTPTIPWLNTSGCPDPTVYEVLKREQRQRFGYRPLAYICSPYSGDVQANTTLAHNICRTALKCKRIPFAPHLLFPQFMNDRNPAERELAMFMNRILLSKCDELWLYTPHVSAGMRAEVCWAKALGTPIRFLDKELQEILP